MSARKKMRLEDGGSSVEEALLEPSATINDLPSEVMKKIFSFVGRGNYCFIGPVSKDFCYNYLTMDVIEDKFAHKMDCQLAIGKNKITSTEAASCSFELAEYSYLKAPEDFQKELIKKAAANGRKDIEEMGLAMGARINPLALRNDDSEKIAKQCDTEMFNILLKTITFGFIWVCSIIKAAVRSDQFHVLQWLKKHNFFQDRHFQNIFERTLFIEAAKRGNLGMIKWAKDIAGFNFQDENHFINTAAESGNIDLVKYLRSSTDIPWNESTFNNAAYGGNIPMLQYLIDNECPHDDPIICAYAVKIHAHEKALEVLQWLHNQNIPWDENTCIASAEKGNLNALKFARLNDCPWDKNCLIKAIKHHHYEVVEYCLQNSCPLGTSDICYYAMDDYDHDRALKMLRLLRKFSIPWGTLTCTFAASYGNFDALKWAVSKGCAFDRQECANNAAWYGNIGALKWIKSQGVIFNEIAAVRAAQNGHIKTLKWLRSEDCPMGKDTFLQASLSGNMDVVEYCIENDFPFEDCIYERIITKFHDPVHLIKLLQKNGYPWYPSACHVAARKGDLQLLRWLRFNKCPWDEKTCNEAVVGDRYEVLKYAHENACPWTKETYAYCFSDEGLDEMYDEIPTDYQCSEEIIEYLHKHNCPQPNPDDWIIEE